MSAKKRATAIFLAFVAIVMSVCAFTASAASDVYFTAVGDELMPLEDSTMPFTRNGKYYLPYTIFSGGALGISYERDVTNYTLALTDGSRTLVFDSLRGYAYDSSNRYSEKLAGANGTVYLPIEFVCGYFGFSFQILDTKPVSVLRVANSSSQSASAFRDSISAGLAQKYLEYRLGEQDETPAPSETETTAVPTAQPSPTPGVSAEPTPEPTPVPAPVTVYITFDDGPNKYTGYILDALDDYELRASFFLTGSLVDMEERQDTVRRIAGSGHAIGVHSYTHKSENMYSSAEALTDELERSNEAIRKVTGERTRLFRFPYGSTYKAVTDSMRDAAVNAGYRYWDWTIDAEDYSQPSADALAASVIEDLDRAEPGSTAVILMHDTANTAAALPDILEHIATGNFRVKLMSVTDTPVNFFGDLR